MISRVDCYINNAQYFALISFLIEVQFCTRSSSDILFKYPWPGEERELQVHRWIEGPCRPTENMNLDKTSGWLSTFQFASGLIVYCECEWVCTWLWCSSWSLWSHDSPLSSGIKMESNGIINTRPPFRNNLRLFFSHPLVITNSMFSEMLISG